MAIGSSTGASTLPTAIARFALLGVILSDRFRAWSDSSAAWARRRFMRDTLAGSITSGRAHPPDAPPVDVRGPASAPRRVTVTWPARCRRTTVREGLYSASCDGDCG